MRIIHGLWLQGLSEAPPLVRLNFDRWAALNPDYELRILDRIGVESLIGCVGLPLADMAPQALSDIVRVRLLLLHGGVWVDASTFPTVPLQDWLPQVLRPSGFFAFEGPAQDRIISSWFLAATPRNPLLGAWWDEILRFWCKPRRLMETHIPPDPLGAVSPDDGASSGVYPYFWLHYLFEYAVTNSDELKTQFVSGAHRSAADCRRLREYLSGGETLTHWPPLAILSQAPVHKLDWRQTYPLARLAALGVSDPAEGRPA